jgi:hypothetical protein
VIIKTRKATKLDKIVTLAGLAASLVLILSIQKAQCQTTPEQFAIDLAQDQQAINAIEEFHMNYAVVKTLPSGDKTTLKVFAKEIDAARYVSQVAIGSQVKVVKTLWKGF